MKGLLSQEDGQAVVEYAVLTVFVLFAAIVLIQALGVSVANLYQDVVASLS